FRRRLQGLLAGLDGRGSGGAGAGAAAGDHGHRGAADGLGQEAVLPVNLLETQKLTKYFGETHAVDAVDFTIREGEVLALIGSNGAGKTGLVNLISGPPTADGGRDRVPRAGRPAPT